jgi:hypothetical protein
MVFLQKIGVIKLEYLTNASPVKLASKRQQNHVDITPLVMNTLF